MKAPLDCVLIGFNDVSLEEYERSLLRLRRASGAYHQFAVDTTYFYGKRISYISLLQHTLERTPLGIPPLRHVGELPNLGLFYLSYFLKKRGLETEIVNNFIYQKRHLLELLTNKPTCVAISTTFMVEDDPIKEIISFVRQCAPGTKIIVGGPRIYNLSVAFELETETRNMAYRELGADVVIYDGQGEQTLAQVVMAIRKRPNGSLSDVLASIPNVVYFENGTYGSTPRLEEFNDLNDNWIDWRAFVSESFTPTTMTRTARGCPFRCGFCRYPILGSSGHYQNVEVVEQELSVMKECGVRFVLFTDDTFNIPKERFKDICRMMIRRSLSLQWVSYFRCAQADEECVNLMKEAGCIGVDMGVESGSQTMLNNMTKDATVDKYEKYIRLLKDCGIITYADIIVGFPGETEATVWETINFLNRTRPDLYHVELYYHMNNTPIARDAYKYGLQGAGYSWKHNTMDWREASEWHKVMLRQITGSMILPRHYFGFYSIPYLLGKGLTREHIMGFLEVARKMLLESLDHVILDSKNYEAELLSVFGVPILPGDANSPVCISSSGYALAPLSTPRPEEVPLRAPA